MPHPGTASQDGALRAHLAGHPRLCPWFLAPGPPGTRALGQAWAGMCVGSLPGSQGSPVGRVDRECWSRRTRRPRARPSPLSARHAPGHPSLPVDRKACLRQSGSRGWHSAGADPTSPELGGRGSWRPLGPGLAAPRSTRAAREAAPQTASAAWDAQWRCSGQRSARGGGATHLHLGPQLEEVERELPCGRECVWPQRGGVRPRLPLTAPRPPCFSLTVVSVWTLPHGRLLPRHFRVLLTAPGRARWAASSHHSSVDVRRLTWM